MDHLFKIIKEKIDNGERITRSEAISLYNSDDILSLGKLASIAKKRKSGNKVYFSLNININHTNICEHSCPLCAFSKKEGEDGNFFMTEDNILERLKSIPDNQIFEVHIVGGLNENYKLSFFTELFRKIKKKWPEIYIQGLTVVEIQYIAEQENLKVETVLKKLRDAGLDCIPGGGAEIFSERVRKIIAPDKISGDRYIEIMETAHVNNIPTNCTMLYGHVETIEERIDHILKIRELQDRTGGVKCFVPLSFHSKNTEFRNIRETTAFDNLKTYAVSRILLDNVDHIKGLWMYMGIPLAQISLNFGVDDLGGTSLDEKIVHAAGAETPDKCESEKLSEIIREAGFIPFLSNSSYTWELKC